MVDDLGEDIGRLLVASLIEDEETDAPFSHGELRHRRRLVAEQLISTESDDRQSEA